MVTMVVFIIALYSTHANDLSNVTWDCASNMHSHGHSQAKADVDAEVLSECSLARYHLCHWAQAKHLNKGYGHN